MNGSSFVFPAARDPLAHADVSRAAIAAACRQDEALAVQALLGQVPADARKPPGALTLARELVQAVRSSRLRASGADALMHEFSLSSDEGVALMCLAEALLRVPDTRTADLLIADKIGKGDWAQHLGTSSSLFVNAAAWGLLVTGKLVAAQNEAGLRAALHRLVARGGEPLVRKGMEYAMRLLGEQFVAGRSIEEALARSGVREQRGYRHSYDMLGEAALTADDAQRYFEAYAHAIQCVGAAATGRGVRNGPGISVKLSALHPRYQHAQRERVLAELLPRLKALMLLAKQADIGLNIDAEEADRLELSLDLLEALAFDPELAGFDGIGFVVQAYQKRCPFAIDYLVELARRSGRRLMVRLVKGAYWDTEIKRAQVDGMSGYPVYTRKAHTDVSYLVCARKLLAAADRLYPQFATHNAHAVATIFTWAQQAGIEDYEFQCLHGMGEPLYDQIVGVGLGQPCRIYAPVGSHETLLAYLVRRLLENGANTSFVNRIVDEHVTIDELLADPFSAAEQSAGLAHPEIALPVQLYGAQRRNFGGIDFSSDAELTALERQLAPFAAGTWHAAPIIAAEARASVPREVRNPADRDDLVGHVIEANTADIEAALAVAAAAAADDRWCALSAAARADVLERAADLIEQNRAELMALIVREAGRTLPNALGEVREAADFLRYYAAQARRDLQGRGLGVILCISPWNFPLAIFIGQASGALAAGNAVLAKPAEQTPLVAARAVHLLHEAGVPRTALQLLPGSGETVGARLVEDTRVRGVLFTGSTEVARSIQRTLLRRMAEEGGDIPLVAETGGQNALIVDSSALPEQVVQDALLSAFDSAGQRCSALRVLCLQSEIADRTMAMLKGAMAELAVGDPRRLSTDIGPLIDAEARDKVLEHVAQLGKPGRVFRTALPVASEHGSFVAPTLIEIESLGQLQREVFGPVLHVLRFRGEALPQLVEAINATGYGLTLGVHSRIDATIDYVIAHARAGNIYVNRNLIGAVVGVQPFGGEGLSGTGPKAGGPLYLKHLQQGAVIEQSGPATPPAPALAALRDWAGTHADAGLRALCEHYAAANPTGREQELAGPTGERNVYALVPRGRVLCLAADSSGLLNQIAACMATGNRVVLAPWLAQPALPHDLPACVQARITAIDRPGFEQVPLQTMLVDMACLKLLPMLARIEGPPMICVPSMSAAPLDLWRLVGERAVCVNTSAAGGNARLLSLRA